MLASREGYVVHHAVGLIHIVAPVEALRQYHVAFELDQTGAQPGGRPTFAFSSPARAACASTSTPAALSTGDDGALSGEAAPVERPRLLTRMRAVARALLFAANPSAMELDGPGPLRAAAPTAVKAMRPRSSRRVLPAAATMPAGSAWLSSPPAAEKAGARRSRRLAALVACDACCCSKRDDSGTMRGDVDTGADVVVAIIGLTAASGTGALPVLAASLPLLPLRFSTNGLAVKVRCRRRRTRMTAATTATRTTMIPPAAAPMASPEPLLAAAVLLASAEDRAATSLGEKQYELPASPPTVRHRGRAATAGQ